MAFTTAMRLVFGFIFRRAGNIVAPCFVHAIPSPTLALGGTMTFVHYVE